MNSGGIYEGVSPEREFFLSLTDAQLKTIYNSLLGMRKQITNRKKDKNALDAAYARLDRIIGVNDVKREIRSIAAYARLEREYVLRGVKTERLSMHMAFLGNPGTAKTTVARMLPDIFYAEGIIHKRKIVEVGRADLVGKYCGHTPEMVKSKFSEADGGILFIDEAYSLKDGNEGSFGDEAISTMITEMENKRDRVIVILAGYPDKMREFLSSNPGAVSRVSNILTFPDYSTDELIDIARFIAGNHSCTFGEDAEAKLRGIFERAKKEPDFGNGRYVRSVVERALRAHAMRFRERPTSDLTDDELFVIDAEDFAPVPVMPGERVGAAIGF